MADVPGKFYRATKVRTGVSPSSPGAIEGEVTPPLNPPGAGLNSVGLTMPSAFTVANSPLTANGTIGVTGAGTVGQYIRGDGSLASFPSLTGFVPYTGATQNVDLGEFGVDAGFVNLDTTPTNTPTTQGTIYWDDARSTAALIMNGTIQHIGQDTFFYVKNSSAYTIPKGTCVRFAGTDGASGHLLILPFTANGVFPSSYFMGVTAEDIANGSFGQVMHFGELTGINTSGFTAGALLYASSTVAGAFQTTAPLAPNNIVLVAAAVNSKVNGSIVVRPTYGSNINNDEGVKITTPTTGDLLQLQAGGLWENKTLAQVIGSAYVPSTRTLTINGTTQDLSANRTFNVGTVTSVGLSSATSGVTIGSTPVTESGTITLAIATASGSQQGLLSSTDWSTFNAKQNALTLTTTGTSGAATLIGSTLNIPQYQSVLTNPITGTGTTNYVPKFTSSSSIGNGLIYDNGTTVLIGTTSTPTPVVGVNFPLSVTSSEATRIRIDSSRGAPNYANAGVGLYASGVQKWSFAHYSTDSGANYDFTIYNDALTSSAILVKGSNSNVLIGTITDGGQKLQVTGTFALRASASGSSATQIPIFNADPSGTTRELVTRTPAQLLSDIGGQAALTNPVTGTGTTNYLPKFTGSTTIGNSIVFDNGTNVSIGATSTNGKLTVVSNPASWNNFANAQLRLGATISGNSISMLFTDGNNSNGWFGYQDNAVSANRYFYWSANDGASQQMQLNSSGNLLVGTTTDNGARLQVSGGITALNSLVVTSSSNAALIASTNSTTGFSYLDFINSGASGRNYQIGVAGNGASSGYANNLYFDLVGVANIMTLTSGRNVLIGTQTDNGARLQVSGAVSTSSKYAWGTAINGTTGQIATDNTHNYFDYLGNLYFRGAAASNNLITFTSAGAATFSSSVQAVGTMFLQRASGGAATTIQFKNEIGNNRAKILFGGSVEELGFYAGDGSVPNLTITQNGNVGIGTPSPTNSRLLVAGTHVSGNSILGVVPVGDQVATIGLYNSSGVRKGLFYSNTGFVRVESDADPIQIYAGGVNGINVTTGGNVLIGTTTDAGARLRVDGDILIPASGRIYGNSATVTGSRSYIELYNANNGNLEIATGFSTASIVFSTQQGNTRMTIASGGAVTINSLGTGTVYSNGGTLTNTNPSDFNLKENIAPINYGLGEILQLNPVTFNWKNDTINQGKQYGFIAQEVQKIMPDLVKKGEYLGLDKEAIFTTLVKAIQELKQEIDTLKN